VKVGDLVKSRVSNEVYGQVLEIYKQFILVQLFCGWYGWLPELQWEVISEV